MVEKLHINQKLFNDKGILVKVLILTDELVAIRILNNPKFVHWLSQDEVLNNYHEIDLSNEFAWEIYLKRVNRSNNQSNELLNLLNNDYDLLLTLEEKIRNNFIHYCPTDIETINEILNLNENDKFFNLNLFRKKE